MEKQIHGATFKKRAPKAIKEVKDFAKKAMVIVTLAHPRGITIHAVDGLLNS